MPVLGITSLYPWERHLTPFPNRLFVWCGKTAQGSVSQWHLPEKKIKKTNNRTNGHGTAGISESGSGQLLPYA